MSVAYYTPETYQLRQELGESWPIVESDDGRNYAAKCGDPACDLAYEHDKFLCSGICNGLEGYMPEVPPEDEYR